MMPKAGIAVSNIDVPAMPLLVQEPSETQLPPQLDAVDKDGAVNMEPTAVITASSDTGLAGAVSAAAEDATSLDSMLQDAVLSISKMQPPISVAQGNSATEDGHPEVTGE